MKVLAVCAFPIDAAATRFRLAQFVEPFRQRGIELEIRPFLSSKQFSEIYTGAGLVKKAFGMMAPLLRRFGLIVGLRKYALIIVQREAVIFGPGFFEWLYQKIGRMPMVLDLDDATYVRYVSPSYGRVGSAFKFFGKTDKLIRRSSLVICGNRFIAEYAESKGTKTVIVPTVVETDLFRPVENHNEVPVVGWIGTHSTFPFLESLFPVLQRLAEKHEFVLKIVGADEEGIELPGVNVVAEEWSLEREVSDFQSLDIGLYPIIASGAANEQWIQGKSGFKAIQYMAVGVPFVMSPVGVCAEIGNAGITHLNAVTQDDWYNALDKLLLDKNLRKQMGLAGREFSVKNYDLGVQAERISTALQKVVRG